MSAQQLELLDQLAGQAESLAAITLASLPTVPTGLWGATLAGLRRQADSTYQGDPAEC